VLVVDDEAPARAKVKRLLADDARFQVLGEASDGTEALAQVEALRPDLLILDIQMPGLTGFEVLEALGPDMWPVVIFSTAYDQFALQAFDVHAVDYLLKPYDAGRFGKALAKALAQLAGARADAVRLEALLADIAQARGPERPLDRLVVKVDEAWTPLHLDQVLRLSAEDKYVRLHTRSGEHLVRQSLRNLEQRLEQARFVRVHRSEIVNIDAVVRLEPWTHGDGILVLTDGTTVVLSRTYRQEFLARWRLPG
jgi:two-component system LytT family response regulator